MTGKRAGLIALIVVAVLVLAGAVAFWFLYRHPGGPLSNGGGAKATTTNPVPLRAVMAYSLLQVSNHGGDDATLQSAHITGARNLELVDAQAWVYGTTGGAGIRAIGPHRPVRDLPPLDGVKLVPLRDRRYGTPGTGAKIVLYVRATSRFGTCVFFKGVDLDYTSGGRRWRAHYDLAMGYRAGRLPPETHCTP